MNDATFFLQTQLGCSSCTQGDPGHNIIAITYNEVNDLFHGWE